MTASEIGYLLKGIKSEIKTQLDELEEDRVIIRMKIDGMGDEPYFAFPKITELLNMKGYRKRFKILSPFDNLIINRNHSILPP